MTSCTSWWANPWEEASDDEDAAAAAVLVSDGVAEPVAGLEAAAGLGDRNLAKVERLMALRLVYGRVGLVIH